MKLSRFADKILAVLRRDLLTALRYRTSFLMGAVAVMAELAAFYYLSRSIGPGFRPQGMAYFPFLLAGTGLYTFLMMGISSFVTSVQEAQQNGTLEVLMTSSTPPSTLIFLSSISAFARNGARLLLYFAAGLLLLAGKTMHRPDIAGGILVLGLSFAIATAIGMTAAALQLSIQKGSAAMWLFGSIAWFMTGTLFPVESLPRPLLRLAQLIPITHCLDALRLALFQSGNHAALGHEILILAAFSAALLPLSLLFFSWTLRHARLQGTLSAY